MDKHIRNAENVIKNKNLCLSIFKFNNTRDILQIAQTNKRLNKISENLDICFGEDCVNHFLPSNSQYKRYDKFFNIYSILIEDNQTQNELNKQTWKSIYHTAIKTKNNWTSFEMNNINCKNLEADKLCSFSNISILSNESLEILNSDITNTCSELYTLLKGNYINLIYLDGSMLPKLRKQNYNLENDNNTNLQRFLFDFIYDSQDLFDYYEEYFGDFENSNNSNLSENSDVFTDLNIKTESLPFEDLLKNFPNLINEFASLEAQEGLYNYRHYINILNNKNSNLTTINTDKKGKHQNLSENSKPAPSNPILFILDSLHKSIQNFCQITLKLIKSQEKQENNNFVIEYTSKFNSYIESSIQINDYLENLVVLINYLYNYYYPDGNNEIIPKFSVFRMMVVCWNKYVLSEISEQLTKRGEKLFEEALEETLEKELENKANKNIQNSILKDNIKITKKDDISGDFYSYMSSANSDEMSVSTQDASYSFGNLNIERLFQIENERAAEKIFSNLNFSLLDHSSNEFSVMLLNSSYMIYEDLYLNFET